MSEQAIAPAALSLKRILFATDFSEASDRALPIAAALARRHNAQVFLTHIWSAGEYAYMAHGEPERAAREKLVQVCRRKEMADITCSIVVKRGVPAEAIDQVTHEHDIDLAVLGTHARTGVSRALHGSVSEQLFRQLCCPVLTVAPHLGERFFASTPAFKRILFPTDLSASSVAAFPELGALATGYGSAITLLRIHSKDKEEGVVEAEKESLLRAFGRAAGNCQVEAVVEYGDTAKAILAFASKHHPDLIAMGLDRAPGVITNFRPTIAYTVVVGAECPVLTFSKPKLKEGNPAAAFR